MSCESCDGGDLEEKRLYRFTGCVVFLGYFLLLASLFGVLLGSIGWTLSVQTGPYMVHPDSMTEQEPRQEQEQEQEQEAEREREREREEALREMLVRVQIPEAMIDRALELEGPPLSEEELEGLTEEQRTLVMFVGAARSLMGVSPLIAFYLVRAFLISVLVVSILAGLLGWFFVRKRQVLQCGACGVEIPRR